MVFKQARMPDLPNHFINIRLGLQHAPAKRNSNHNLLLELYIVGREEPLLAVVLAEPPIIIREFLVLS
jgi:hypothetical protein